ncbi:MAG: radical SAM protein [Thermodesulfobacteriota bacterium]
METNRWSLSDYLQIGFGGFPFGGLMSIDVTYRCNLHCLHCYFSRQDYTSELSVDKWIAQLENMKSRGKPLFICGWLGGEPLLRPDVIEAGKKFFKSNIIFTNGTIELPSWPDCTFVVSVPYTKIHYQEITGADDKVYDLVKEHANRPDLNVIVSFCIMRKNVSSILSFLLEWQNDTKIRGVFFEFHTPRVGEGKELWLDWSERDYIIGNLLALKKTYGDFIYNTFQTLELMKSQHLQKILSDCPFDYLGLSLDPMGHPKYPCTLGPEADCCRCGCILPIFSSILYKRGWLIRGFVEGIKRGFRERRKKGGRHVKTG